MHFAVVQPLNQFCDRGRLVSGRFKAAVDFKFFLHSLFLENRFLQRIIKGIIWGNF